MGGSSGGHKGGVLGAVPLKRKTPGVFGFWSVCCLFGVSVWGRMCVGGCVWVCVLALWGCACWSWWLGWMGVLLFSVGGGFLGFVSYLPGVPFAVLMVQKYPLQCYCY